jgi:Uma2 family endonuclease
MTTAVTAKRSHRLAAPKNLPDSKITVEQWAALGEVKPPYELIDGILVQKMVTTNEHDWGVGSIFAECRAWGREIGWRFFTQGSGTRLDNYNGFIPDVMGFSPHVKLRGTDSYSPPPFIAFEVLSPRTAKADRGKKNASL